ncbi:hypothetical protein DVH24_017187 [Malus domestica]|uniref:Leucine-rich repeat-containing N-terminal plant-type domain-containing protein n=1 Tax=Malus domestica TaxID=3750 RepID=A0A498IVI3_MALDO|nr:hypothetical protein DVH24_017187 [Malus domestica]
MEGRAQSSPFRCTNLLLPLLHCFLRSFIVAAAATNITTDQSALLALKSYITHDPHNVLAKNWSATTVCAWIGVTCNAPHNRVHALFIIFKFIRSGGVNRRKKKRLLDNMNTVHIVVMLGKVNSNEADTRSQVLYANTGSQKNQAKEADTGS